jgi:Ca-activated chloride channel family protein
MITQLENFHFIRPWILLAIPLVVFIIWHLHRYTNKQDSWAKICDPHLLSAIKIKDSTNGSGWSKLLYPICIIALFAAAGPAFRQLPTPVVKNQSALILALDVSKSMLSDDMKPNRLERAKFKINDILAKRKDGQTALIVYAGDAFVVTPLSDDIETIALMLKALSPNIMPVQGSRADIALEKARQLITQADYFNGEVLLITDGVNLSKTNSKAKELANDNIKTSVLAIGTVEGAPISYDGKLVKDRAGNIVVPKLDIAQLSEVAANGNGRFALISGDNKDIDYLIIDEIDKQNNTEINNDSESNFETQKYIDDGPWLLLLAIPLFALLYRKGLLLSVFLVFSLQIPQPSQALDWDDLWLNADQKAAKQLQNEQAELAYETAKSDSWKASAAYKKQDFKNAAELFNGKQADDFYNKANALAMSGELESAIDEYNKSLALRPDDEDTIYNKELVEKALEQQKQQEQQDQQDQQDQDKQENQDNKDQQEQENQDQQDQNSEDGEKQEGENKDSSESKENESDNPEQQEQENKDGEMTEEEKRQQEQEQKALEEADKEQAEKEAEQQKAQQVQEQKIDEAEQKEAIEQWLRRIPDDPGGLLRRKFYYQYNQQNQKPDESEDW